MTHTPLSAGKKVLFAFLPAVLLLAFTEAILRWTGAAEGCSARLNASIAVGRCHPILGYTAFPNREAPGRSFNSDGFRSREFTAKAAGIYRVVTLGDSCTFGMTAFKEGFFAAHPYPQRLEEIAEKRMGPGRVEVLNAGMGGYNSFHGLMVARSMLGRLEPDLITVRFGWNDHFTSPQGSYLREPSNRVALAAQDLLLGTATYRFAMRLGNEFRARSNPAKPRLPTQWQPDVSLEEFRRNLRRIVEVGTEMGARVWLLTAPDPFSSEKMLQRYETLPPGAEARRAIEIHGLPSFRKLMDIHRQYARIVREVGAETGASVVDIAAIYDRHPTETLFSLDDPVHPRQRGYDLEAQVLYDRIVSEGLVVTNR